MYQQDSNRCHRARGDLFTWHKFESSSKPQFRHAYLKLRHCQEVGKCCLRQIQCWSEVCGVEGVHSGGFACLLRNHCFAVHCSTHDLLLCALTICTTVCCRFPSFLCIIASFCYVICWPFTSNLLSSVLCSSISTTLLPHAAAEKKGASRRGGCGKGWLSQAVSLWCF